MPLFVKIFQIHLYFTKSYTAIWHELYLQTVLQSQIVPRLNYWLLLILHSILINPISVSWPAIYI